MTRALIQNISRKHKYLSGGLMFAKDEYIVDTQKEEIMNAFEEVLFAGLARNQYNILWVEHHDKGRLELNFVVPRIELETGNDLDLYSHRRDLPLFDMWKNGINIKYQLSDPNDPRRARTISERTKVERGAGSIVANRQNLDETLHKLVQDGQIRNRAQMIELLEKSGYQITRKNEESISVKHPDIGKKALRLKGGIYSETFTSTRGIESLSEERKRRIEEYDNKVARGEVVPNRSTYKKYLQARVERHQKRYSRVRQVDSPKPSNTQTRDADTMVEKNDYEVERRINDRVREFVEANRRRREKNFKRSRDREDELLRRIEKFNLQVQEQLGTAEQGVYANLAETRAVVEADIANNARRIDTKIIYADERNRGFTERIQRLFSDVNAQIGSITKSIKGAVDEIRKIRIANRIKQKLVSKKRSKLKIIWR